MNDEKINRKLTAILSADAKGYSRLMGKDDVATVQTLKKCRHEISTLIRVWIGQGKHTIFGGFRFVQRI
jgi:hypothetical protein